MMSDTKKRGLFRKAERVDDLLPEDTTPTLGFFFKQLWRKKGTLLSLNLLMVVRFLPLAAVVLIYLLGQKTPTMANPVFAPLLGISLAGQSANAGAASLGTLLGIFGEQISIAFPTTAAKVWMAVLLGFTVLTWGWQTVGGTYNLRSLVRGDSCFLWSDYFYAIKRNLKQGFFFGLLDALIIAVLCFDWFYFNSLAGYSLFYSAMYFFTLVMIIIYACMRFYIYPMMITFDLPVKKLLKNALIFSMLGIKRNMMALLGIVVVFAINLALIGPSLSIGFTLTLILPFFYLPALAGFMSVYASYPNIQRYMIDGSAPNNEEELTPPEAD